MSRFSPFSNSPAINAFRQTSMGDALTAQSEYGLEAALGAQGALGELDASRAYMDKYRSARAKAIKQLEGSQGGGTSGIVGGIASAGLGAVGTAVGGPIGGFLGSTIGRTIGGLFG